MSNPIKKSDAKKVVITKNPEGNSSEFTQSIFQNNQCFTEVMSLPEMEVALLKLWEAYKQTSINLPTKTIQLLHNGKGKISKKQSDTSNKKLFTKVEKQYLVPPTTKFLHHLGVTASSGQVKAQMQGKYRQINKFVEIINTTIKPADRKGLNIYDFGCGKGYLTMALHDYLTTQNGESVITTGIDLKESVIRDNQKTAELCEYTDLHFVHGDISNVEMARGGMLIALHACDIATDIALHKGIISQAKYLIASPCCHKQVRKSMQHQSATKPITEHGILLERQAEILTDTIRCLLLEQHGYRTDIFEFISTEHTSKNLIIRAVYTGNKKDNREQIDQLMQLFGLSEQQYLDGLLG